MIRDIKKQLAKLEKYLNTNIFSNFSRLPDYLHKGLVRFLPIICLALGLLCLLGAYDLWRTSQNINSLIDYANNNSALYGVPHFKVDHHTGLIFWLSIVILIYEAYLFIKAAPLVKQRLLSGWYLIYYAFVFNVIYGVVMLFNYYGGLGALLIRLIFSFVCLYFLFEIKESYKANHAKKKGL